MSPELRFATVRPLIKYGRAKEAWLLLQVDPQMEGHHNFRRTAMRLGKIAQQGSETFTEVRRFVSRGAPKQKRHRIALPFPAADDIKDRDVGTANALFSSHVDERHISAFWAETEAFEQRARRPRRPLGFELRDVFVNVDGHVWNKKGEIIVDVGRPVPQFDEAACPVVPEAISGLRATRGIYHWLVDTMPTLSAIRERDSAKILIAEKAPQFEYESLQLAGVPDEAIEKCSGIRFVERLILPSVGMATLRLWSRVGTLFEAMKQSATALSSGEDLAEKIYISRRDSVRRRLTNEQELEDRLSENGYRIVEMATIPFWKQVALAASAREIMGPHGAGLSHILFAQPGTKVTELLPITDGTYFLRFNYARLSLVLGLDYKAWIEPQPVMTDAWHLDLAELFDSGLIS